LKEVDIRRLLLGIAEKDEESFSQLFSAYYPKLIQLALAFVPEIVAAQEIVSDVFYKILKSPKNLDRITDFDNYIFITVRNQSFTYLKKNKHKVFFDTIDQKADYLLHDHKNPEKSLLSDELFSLVDEAIHNLPPKRKVIFLLVKEEGKKYKEVAQILNISIKTVELQMSLALKKIRKIITDYQQFEDVKIKKIDGSNLLNLCILIFLSGLI
jgi:RNA polymerase sigma-70 factor (ECF subfamily)